MERNHEKMEYVLNFLNHDWFQRGNDKIVVHLYVKDVVHCSADFKEDFIAIQFETSNEQFLKIHGPKTDDGKVKIIFKYSIYTCGKIVPEQCSYATSTVRIELNITKAIPNRWVSLETQKAVIDRKKVSCAHIESSKMNCFEAETSSSAAVNSPKTVDESSSSKWFASSMINSCRSPENMMLLGGKSTPVSRKGNEPESKTEKETAVCSDQQASALARDSGSLKNMNKQIATGLTGLENYANNCYMNVVIQALANIPEIRDYFMYDQYLNSLSTNNPLSSGGHVARAFSEVVKALWSGVKKTVKPAGLKSIMGKRYSSFYGYQQCDAQEFFSSLLDNLHEDMNHGVRAERSKESAQKEGEGPSVSEKPDTAWNEHCKRQNSLIVKMFHGQMVSKLTCLGCHKKSTMYEACAQISLPIAMSRVRIQVTVFFRDHFRLPERLRLQISTPNAQIWHLLNVLERYIGVPAHCLRVCHDNKGSSIPSFNDDYPLASVRSLKQLIVCEVKDERETDYISLPFKQSYSLKLTTCSSCGKSPTGTEAKLKRCTRCFSVAYCSRDCQTKHWPTHQQDCKKSLKAPVGLPFYITILKHKLNFETLACEALHYANYSIAIAEKETEHSDGEPEEKKSTRLESPPTAKLPEKYLKPSSVSDSDQDGRKSAAKLEEASNSVSKKGENYAWVREAEKDEKHLQLKMEGASNISSSLHDYFAIKAYVKPEQESVGIHREDFKLDTIASAAFLVIEWQKDAVKEKDSKELNTPFKTVQGCLSDEEYGDRCSIGDCFSLFLEPEKLSEKDGWKCPKCKTVQALKKEMAMSYPPPVLLVHFKRFTFGSYGQKVTKGINYPISGLDLSHYITEETKSLLSNHPVYDLTGVICHKGSMGIGHYTCVVRCLNQPGQPDIGWRYFDDDIVSKVDDDKVCDCSAYVLVYRVRGMSQALQVECPFVVPLPVNESVQERSRATGKFLSISSENDSENNSKPQVLENGAFKGTAKNIEKRLNPDHKETGLTFPPSQAGVESRGAKELLKEEKGPGLSDEDFSEDSFELANDIDLGEMSKQQPRIELNENESVREALSNLSHHASDEMKDIVVEPLDVSSHGLENRDALVEYIDMGCGKTQEGSMSKSCGQPADDNIETKEFEEDGEEQFFLAPSNLESYDLEELTESDLD